MKNLFVGILLLAAIAPALSQHLSPSQESRIKTMGNNFIKEKESIALSIGIIHNQHSYHYHFGAVAPNATATPTSESVYQLGSVTKTFVSLLLAKAVVAKKVSLHDDIRKYLDGDFPNLEYQGQPVTIIHLVNLTSGLPDNLLPADAPKITESDSSAFQTEAMLGKLTQQDFLNALKTVKLDTIPGCYPRHSNTAAQTLRYIVEKIYGLPIEKCVKQFILDPLQMNNTSFGTEGQTKQLMTGHDLNNRPTPWFTNSYHSGTGGMRASVGDMTKYVSYLMQHPDEESKMVLRKTILINAGTNKVVGTNPIDQADPTHYSISFNWYHYTPDKGKTQIWADGGTPGFACYVIMYPDSDLGVVLLTNKLDEKIFGGLGALSADIHQLLKKGK